MMRARRGKEIGERLAERRGIERGARPPGRLLWLHAASVGETVSILPVLAALGEQADDHTTLLTTGTVTSARLAAQRLTELGLTDRVLHRFAPLDVPSWVRRFLDHWRPEAAGFVESELWPNTLAACRRRGVPVMLLNGRLSERSFARWQRVPGFARALLGGFERLEAQSERDAERFRLLGARCVSAPGNLKFAALPLPVDEAERARLAARIGARPVWLAASTHPGEERLIAEAHTRLVATHPRLLTILAPRHPERGARLAQELAPGPVNRRAAGEDPPDGAGLWIADTMGELGLLYRLVPVVVIGRSFVPPGGGQNPLEASRLGCAVAVGPHTGNFVEVLRILEAAGAIARVDGVEELVAWAGAMLGDRARREAAGRAGQLAAQRYAELPQRTAARLLAMMRPGVRSGQA